ncbi:TIGR00730 family Rossman fold protein [Allobranchiibius sp. GilTou38]|uniref:LOG family protein n=1 Tax=Allobranchiibius sp. GilTou38 TaxID=2815210 RepID=UPI001AA1B327|nr:TIGR00730 family Rossman fold protein [Allobranchiibius sp. GilTou38]MBO1767320.1 TIGR00730 family Rossman fold protein [Allobranchiibius sp. GilTou38]
MRVAIFIGSSPGNDPAYADAAAALATHLAQRRVGIVYGGGHVGLMGVVADAALQAGGDVIGVIPRSLADAEVAHGALSHLEVVETMHERKARMAQLADAFVALPGGIGTMEEFFEVWTWLQLGIHAKPVALYDVEDFWAPMRTLVTSMVDAGFLRAEIAEKLIQVDDPDALLAGIARWKPVAQRWSPPAP